MAMRAEKMQNAEINKFIRITQTVLVRTLIFHVLRGVQVMINRFSGLLGYEKTLSPAGVKRAVFTLSKLYLFALWDTNVNDAGNEIISEAELIVHCLQTGQMPDKSVDQKCYKCHKNNCDGKALCPKGKTVYSIGDEKFRIYITKTGYGFANYLINAGLTTYEAVQEIIDGEASQIEKSPKRAVLHEPERQAEKNPALSTEDEYLAWLDEETLNYGVINMLQAAKTRILKEIFLDVLWQYDDPYDKKLLVLIDNIENYRCRRDLISRLQPNNRASLKVFEHVTGITLPKTRTERIALLNKISSAAYSIHPQEYKPKNVTKKEAFSDRFYMLCGRGDNTKGFIEGRGKLWRHKGVDFFIQKKGGNFKASEGRTGLLVRDNCPSIEILEKSIIKTLAEMGVKFEDYINNALKESGVSPLYTAI